MDDGTEAVKGIPRGYISGPMTGLPELNFPAFHRAAERWRDRGWAIVNPAEMECGRTDLPREHYMRRDIRAIIAMSEDEDAERIAVLLLPGWRQSQGSKLEVSIAYACGCELLDAITGDPVHETICQEADRIVSGARQADYGHPRDDFAKAAKMWTGTLLPKLRTGSEVEPLDVALCMIQVKLSRHVNRSKRDNLVDACGYAKTAAMIGGWE